MRKGERVLEEEDECPDYVVLVVPAPGLPITARRCTVLDPTRDARPLPNVFGVKINLDADDTGLASITLIRRRYERFGFPSFGRRMIEYQQTTKLFNILVEESK